MVFQMIVQSRISCAGQKPAEPALTLSPDLIPLGLVNLDICIYLLFIVFAPRLARPKASHGKLRKVNDLSEGFRLTKTGPARRALQCANECHR